jgi:phosphoserine phosphatase RsbU/P
MAGTVATIWRLLGRLGQLFLLSLALAVVSYYSRISSSLTAAAVLLCCGFGLVCAYRLARRLTKRLIWRLRNRLIVAYLFIAVVPVVLILSLASIAGYIVLGQMAVYLVNTKLTERLGVLQRPAEVLVNFGNPGNGGSGQAGGPGPAMFGPYAGRGGPAPGGPPGPGGPDPAGQPPRLTPAQRRAIRVLAAAQEAARAANRASQQTVDPEVLLSRVVSPMLRPTYPDFQVYTSGSREARLPKDSTLTHPEGVTKGSGLIVRTEGGREKLYAWVHRENGNNKITIIAPITSDLLSGLAPVTLDPLTGQVAHFGRVYISKANNQVLVSPSRDARLPTAADFLDFQVHGWYNFNVPSWEAVAADEDLLVLNVETRASTVLSAIFQRIEWADFFFVLFAVLAGLFFLVEMFALLTGVKLSRSITGAVHELYEGTARVQNGDFSYRVPVKGDDQLAELTTSFNTMAENLGKLIVVAKEKERLESELGIAREVQNQLFPKDVPFTKTLELKGVCKPARMVSGDYYDFLALGESELAFAIGDVAGKGISAALLMATIQSTMRTQLGDASGDGGPRRQLSTAHLVSVLNRQLFATTAPEKYATFYFALYEEPTHSLTYTNAGHLAPMLVRGNNIQMLDSTGTVVGAFPTAQYAEKTVPLEHGDILVAYTDGIVEPENVYGEMFGEDRLKDLLVKYSQADSSEIIARTMEAVHLWTGDGELQDDMTMVIARRV